MKITCSADLEGLSYPCQLQGADLRGAELQGFNFLRANLRNADLFRANLRGADLRCADLEGANLRGANLEGANLTRADLRGAELRGADLRGANLRDALFEGANLSGAKLPEFLVKLPPLGQSFIAWKKVLGSFILKLEIPADSPRVSTFIGRKCRAKGAKVLEAFEISGDPTEETEFRSLRDRDFIYRVGQTVKVSDFDDDIRVECTQGIHFFETREEAWGY